MQFESATALPMAANREPVAITGSLAEQSQRCTDRLSVVQVSRMDTPAAIIVSEDHGRLITA